MSSSLQMKPKKKGNYICRVGARIRREERSDLGRRRRWHGMMASRTRARRRPSVAMLPGLGSASSPALSTLSAVSQKRSAPGRPDCVSASSLPLCKMSQERPWSSSTSVKNDCPEKDNTSEMEAATRETNRLLEAKAIERWNRYPEMATQVQMFSLSFFWSLAVVWQLMIVFHWNSSLSLIRFWYPPLFQIWEVNELQGSWQSSTWRNRGNTVSSIRRWWSIYHTMVCRSILQLFTSFIHWWWYQTIRNCRMILPYARGISAVILRKMNRSSDACTTQ